MPSIFAIVAFIALIDPFDPAWERTKTIAIDDLAALQGKWKLVSFEENGEVREDHGLDFYLIIRGRTITRDSEVHRKYKQELFQIAMICGDTQLKAIDFTVKNKRDSEAIYELKNGVLRICSRQLKEGIPERPVEFVTTNRPDCTIVVLRREAK